MSFRSKGRPGTGGGGGSNLDDLMMSYADLNSNNRARGFKGPAVKDIKQAEHKAAKYEPSTKARDWKSLDQSLESAFSVSTSNGVHQQQRPAFVNPIGDVGQFFNANQNNAPSQKSIIEDDWGDFQSPTVSSNTTQNSALANNILLSNQKQPPIMNSAYKPPLYPPIQSPISFPTAHIPTLAPLLPSGNSYSSMGGSGQQPFSLAPQSLPTNLISSPFNHENSLHNQNLPPPPKIMETVRPTEIKSIAKESVGCRLASFQEESPVHRFKSATKPVAKVDIIDDDFGDFTGGSNNFTGKSLPGVVQPIQSLSLPPAINIPPLVSSSHPAPFSSLSPVPHNSLTPTAGNISATNGQQDKYSALRDLFGSTSSEAPASDDMPRTEMKVDALNIETHNSSADNLINNSNLSRYSLSPMPNGRLNTSSDQLMPTNSSMIPPPAANLLAPSPTAGIFNTSSEQLINAPFNNSNNDPFNTSNSNDLFTSKDKITLNDFLNEDSSFADVYQNDLLPVRDIAAKLTNNNTVTIEDDFGDFESGFGDNVGAGNNLVADDYDEWSLPNTTSIEPIKPGQALPIKTFGVTISKTGTANAPYFSSSPPLHSSTPPPIDPVAVHTSDLEFVLPSETLQLPDKVVFGINQKPKENATKKKNAPASLTDLLHQTIDQKQDPVKEAEKVKPSVQPDIDVRLASVDLDLVSGGTRLDPGWKQDDVFVSSEDHESKKSLTTTSSGKSSSKSPDSPQSLRLPSISPETGSIASLEFDTENRLSISELNKKSISNETPDIVDSWLDVLAEIENIFNSAAKTYRNIESNEIKITILKSEACGSYLENLREVSGVFKRIKHSAKVKSLANQEISNQFNAIECAWKELISETNNSNHLSINDNSFYPGVDNSARICGICLCAVQSNPKTSFQNGEKAGNSHVIAFNGHEYHAACANFWVNCISSTLLSLDNSNRLHD